MAFRGHGKIADSWWGATVPPTGPVGTANTYAGVLVTFHVPGRVFGFRVYRPSGAASAPHVLFSTAAGELVCAKTFADVVMPADGWQQCWIHPTVRVPSGVDYRLSVMLPLGKLFRQNTALVAPPVRHSNIDFNYSYQTTSLDPVNSAVTGNTNANAVDVLFQPD